MNSPESTRFHSNIIDNPRPHSLESFGIAYRLILNHLFQNQNRIKTHVTYPNLGTFGVSHHFEIDDYNPNSGNR